MVRVRVFLEQDVVTAARERMRVIFDLFDSVVVMFSGGKDSQVCLELALEVARERGRLPLDVVFRDEEVIQQDVLDHVDAYRQRPEIRMRWYAVPLRSGRKVLGRVLDYVQWDPGREWVRQPPPWAIRLPDGDGRVFEQMAMDDFVAEGYPGKVAFVTGIRGVESLARLRSVMNKLNLNYICATKAGARSRVMLCKPIYDWNVSDVLKWLHENGHRWAPTYDWQSLNGEPLRVSTPLHAEAVRSTLEHHHLRRRHPEFYERILAVFPETALHERYGAELSTLEVADTYEPEGWDGCARYIAEHYLEPRQRADAEARLREMRVLGARDPLGYTPGMLLRQLALGVVKRTLPPTGRRTARALKHRR